MQKLFLSITLLFSGAFSFTIDDHSFLNGKSIPAVCVSHYLNEFGKNNPNNNTCTTVKLSDGLYYFRCPHIDLNLLKEMYEQYHSAKITTDNSTESTNNVENDQQTPEQSIAESNG